MQGVFLMEGMWSRFFPAEQALRTLLRSGAIGEPLQADARFTFAGSEVRACTVACNRRSEENQSCSACSKQDLCRGQCEHACCHCLLASLLVRSLIGLIDAYSCRRRHH